MLENVNSLAGTTNKKYTDLQVRFTSSLVFEGWPSKRKEINNDHESTYIENPEFIAHHLPRRCPKF